MEAGTYRRKHLCHTTEMSAGIDTKKEINRSSSCCVFECFVKTFVSRIRGTPNLILQRLVYIVFCVRFDDKESSKLRADLKSRRIVPFRRNEGRYIDGCRYKTLNRSLAGWRLVVNIVKRSGDSQPRPSLTLLLQILLWNRRDTWHTRRSYAAIAASTTALSMIGSLLIPVLQIWI